MKNTAILFFQAVIIIIAITAFILMTRLPLTEGRAKNLDLFSIYADPFILYGYAASVVFFIGLYKAFILLGYIGQNKAHSLRSLKTVRTIKYCAITLSLLIAMAGLYIKIFHNKGDDPAGFLAMCAITVLASLVVAIAATRFEKQVQNTIGKNQVRHS